MGLCYCVLIFIMLVHTVNCYPNGQVVDSACSSMMPDHGALPQNSTAPYGIMFSPSLINPGDNVTVSLFANSALSGYKGFMIQARCADDSSQEPLGTFTGNTLTRHACLEHALVHSSSFSKTQLTITWTSPETLSCNVTFRATFVQSKLILWVNVTSSLLSVNVSTTVTTAASTTAAPATTTANTTSAPTTTTASNGTDVPRTTTASSGTDVPRTTTASNGTDVPRTTTAYHGTDVPRTTATSRNNYDVPSGVCAGANYKNSVANLPYPGDCTKVIQCYYNSNSKTTLAVIRRCSPGEFWSPENQECASSWTVQCPYDQCRNGSQIESFWDCSLLEQDDVVTYPMPGARRGYYRCKQGRSYPECCPWKSEYIQGLGCRKNSAAVEKCGPEKSCTTGISVCEKLPAWKNQKSYVEQTQVLLPNQVSCAFGNFDIVECKCEVRTLSEYFQARPSCPLIFEAFTASQCNDERYIVPAAAGQRNTNRQVTIKLWLRLQSPHFEITASPNTTAQDSYGLKLWGDMETISVAIGRSGCNDLSQTSVLWKSASGQLEISILLVDGRLTLGVTQGDYTVVSTEEAKQASKYAKFTHEQLLEVKSDFKDTCIVSKIKVYDCLQRFNSIYNNSNN